MLSLNSKISTSRLNFLLKYQNVLFKLENFDFNLLIPFLK